MKALSLNYVPFIWETGDAEKSMLWYNFQNIIAYFVGRYVRNKWIMHLQ